MLKVLILVCAASIDHGACRPETAIDVIHMPRVVTPMQCAFGAQSMLAQTSLRLDADTYEKVVCVRDTVDGAVSR